MNHKHIVCQTVGLGFCVTKVYNIIIAPGDVEFPCPQPLIMYLVLRQCMLVETVVLAALCTLVCIT